MKIIVTGGAGFLGMNLCLHLVREGHEVVVLDNYSTSPSANIPMLEKTKGVELVEHDIIEPLPDIRGVEFIYNLACPASPPKYQKDPIRTLNTSMFGVSNVLQFAKKECIPILHSSTSEVYGDPLEHPQKETYWGNVNPVGVRSCYDEGKRVAETILTDFHRQYSHPIKIVRIFNTYGPHMSLSDGRVVTNFISQALSGKKLTIYGDGKQTRSFCYVDDLIEGLVRMANTPPEFVGPVNLGNPHENTMLELADILESVLGRKIERTFVQLPKDDPVRRNPDISQARKHLSWQPKTDLREGLERTLKYFLDTGVVNKWEK